MRSHPMRFSTLFALAAAFCAVMCLSFLPASAQETGSLAGEMRAALARGGVAEAQRRFDEIWPAEKDRYPYDHSDFMVLMQEQMETGDPETLTLLADISGKAMLEKMNAAMPEMEAAAAAYEAEVTEAVAEQEARDAAIEEETQAGAAQQLGAARDDLQRFTGMYGEFPREMFVTVTCDGHLAAGPMWADVAPWILRSATETVFTYSSSFMTFAMEFETDGSGQGVSLSHDIDGAPSPMARSGDLAEEFSACLPAPVR